MAVSGSNLVGSPDFDNADAARRTTFTSYSEQTGTNASGQSVTYREAAIVMLRRLGVPDAPDSTFRAFDWAKLAAYQFAINQSKVWETRDGRLVTTDDVVRFIESIPDRADLQDAFLNSAIDILIDDTVTSFSPTAAERSRLYNAVFSRAVNDLGRGIGFRDLEAFRVKLVNITSSPMVVTAIWADVRAQLQTIPAPQPAPNPTPQPIANPETFAGYFAAIDTPAERKSITLSLNPVPKLVLDGFTVRYVDDDQATGSINTLAGLDLLAQPYASALHQYAKKVRTLFEEIDNATALQLLSFPGSAERHPIYKLQQLASQALAKISNAWGDWRSALDSGRSGDHTRAQASFISLKNAVSSTSQGSLRAILAEMGGENAQLKANITNANWTAIGVADSLGMTAAAVVGSLFGPVGTVAALTLYNTATYVLPRMYSDGATIEKLNQIQGGPMTRAFVTLTSGFGPGGALTGAKRFVIDVAYDAATNGMTTVIKNAEDPNGPPVTPEQVWADVGSGALFSMVVQGGIKVFRTVKTGGTIKVEAVSDVEARNFISGNQNSIERDLRAVGSNDVDASPNRLATVSETRGGSAAQRVVAVTPIGARSTLISQATDAPNISARPVNGRRVTDVPTRRLETAPPPPNPNPNPNPKPIGPVTTPRTPNQSASLSPIRVTSMDLPQQMAQSVEGRRAIEALNSTGYRSADEADDAISLSVRQWAMTAGVDSQEIGWIVYRANDGTVRAIPQFWVGDASSVQIPIGGAISVMPQTGVTDIFIGHTHPLDYFPQSGLSSAASNNGRPGDLEFLGEFAASARAQYGTQVSVSMSSRDYLWNARTVGSSQGYVSNPIARVVARLNGNSVGSGPSDPSFTVNSTDGGVLPATILIGGNRVDTNALLPSSNGQRVDSIANENAARTALNGSGVQVPIGPVTRDLGQVTRDAGISFNQGLTTGRMNLVDLLLGGGGSQTSALRSPNDADLSILIGGRGNRPSQSAVQIDLSGTLSAQVNRDALTRKLIDLLPFGSPDQKNAAFEFIKRQLSSRGIPETRTFEIGRQVRVEVSRQGLPEGVTQIDRVNDPNLGQIVLIHFESGLKVAGSRPPGASDFTYRAMLPEGTKVIQQASGNTPEQIVTLRQDTIYDVSGTSNPELFLRARQINEPSLVTTGASRGTIDAAGVNVRTSSLLPVQSGLYLGFSRAQLDALVLRGVIVRQGDDFILNTRAYHSTGDYQLGSGESPFSLNLQLLDLNRVDSNSNIVDKLWELQRTLTGLGPEKLPGLTIQSGVAYRVVLDETSVLSADQVRMINEGLKGKGSGTDQVWVREQLNAANTRNNVNSLLRLVNGSDRALPTNAVIEIKPESRGIGDAPDSEIKGAFENLSKSLESYGVKLDLQSTAAARWVWESSTTVAPGPAEAFLLRLFGATTPAGWRASSPQLEAALGRSTGGAIVPAGTRREVGINLAGQYAPSRAIFPADGSVPTLERASELTTGGNSLVEIRRASGPTLTVEAPPAIADILAAQPGRGEPGALKAMYETSPRVRKAGYIALKDYLDSRIGAATGSKADALAELATQVNSEASRMAATQIGSLNRLGHSYLRAFLLVDQGGIALTRANVLQLMPSINDIGFQTRDLPWHGTFQTGALRRPEAMPQETYDTVIGALESFDKLYDLLKKVSEGKISTNSSGVLIAYIGSGDLGIGGGTGIGANPELAPPVRTLAEVEQMFPAIFADRSVIANEADAAAFVNGYNSARNSARSTAFQRFNQEPGTDSAIALNRADREIATAEMESDFRIAGLAAVQGARIRVSDQVQNAYLNGYIQTINNGRLARGEEPFTEAQITVARTTFASARAAGKPESDAAALAVAEAAKAPASTNPVATPIEPVANIKKTQAEWLSDIAAAKKVAQLNGNKSGELFTDLLTGLVTSLPQFKDGIQGNAVATLARTMGSNYTAIVTALGRGDLAVFAAVVQDLSETIAAAATGNGTQVTINGVKALGDTLLVLGNKNKDSTMILAGTLFKEISGVVETASITRQKGDANGKPIPKLGVDGKALVIDGKPVFETEPVPGATEGRAILATGNVLKKLGELSNSNEIRGLAETVIGVSQYVTLSHNDIPNDGTSALLVQTGKGLNLLIGGKTGKLTEDLFGSFAYGIGGAAERSLVYLPSNERLIVSVPVMEGGTAVPGMFMDLVATNSKGEVIAGPPIRVPVMTGGKVVAGKTQSIYAFNQDGTPVYTQVAQQALDANGNKVFDGTKAVLQKVVIPGAVEGRAIAGGGKAITAIGVYLNSTELQALGAVTQGVGSFVAQNRNGTFGDAQGQLALGIAAGAKIAIGGKAGDFIGQLGSIANTTFLAAGLQREVKIDGRVQYRDGKPIYEQIPGTEGAYISAGGQIITAAGKLFDSKELEGAGIIIDGVGQFVKLDKDGTYGNGQAALSSAIGRGLNVIIPGPIGDKIEKLSEIAVSYFKIAANTVAGGATQMYIDLAIQVLEFAGVKVPAWLKNGVFGALSSLGPEAAFFGQILSTFMLANNPVGWAVLIGTSLMRLFQMGTFSRTTVLASGIDLDGDSKADDNASLRSEFRKGFFRTSQTKHNILYDVNGVDVRLLSQANVTIAPEVLAAPIEWMGGSRGPATPTIVLGGQRYLGKLLDGSGREVNRNGYSGNGRGSTVAKGPFTFVTTSNGISGIASLMPASSGTGSRTFLVRANPDYDSESGGSAWLIDQPTDRFVMTVGANYNAINPSTQAVGVSKTYNLSAAEAAAWRAAVGGDQVTIGSTDPRMAAGSPLGGLLETLVVQYQGNRNDPNLYQYMDMNGDGIVDLVRIGLVNSGLKVQGDGKVEVTILDANRVPTAFNYTANDFNEAEEIGTLTSSLLRWGVSHPELWDGGRDLASLYRAAAASGALGLMREANVLSVQTIAAILANPSVDQEASLMRLEQIDTFLNGQFNVDAYMDTNPDVRAWAKNDANLAVYHYLNYGNSEGRFINAQGAKLPRWQPPSSAWTEQQTLAYVASYPDLMNAFGTNTDAAKAHWNSNGRWEGRATTFNVDAYMAAHPYLRAQAVAALSVETRQIRTDENGNPLYSTDDNGDSRPLYVYNWDGESVSTTVAPTEEQIRDFAVKHWITTGRTENANPYAVSLSAMPGVQVLGDRVVNGTIGPNQSLVSADGRFSATMQADGNFVVYDRLVRGVAWTVGTTAGGAMVMQGDGNVVLYRPGGGRADWASGTNSAGVMREFTLVMQGDGNLVAYDSQGGEPIWSTLTGRITLAEPNGKGPTMADYNARVAAAQAAALAAASAQLRANAGRLVVESNDDGGRNYAVVWPDGFRINVRAYSDDNGYSSYIAYANDDSYQLRYTEDPETGQPLFERPAYL
jgi:hypothetical protein